MTDYVAAPEAGEGGAGEALDDDIGVAVEFEEGEDDDEEGGQAAELDDDEDEGDDEEGEGGRRGVAGMDVDAGEEGGDDGVPVAQIDAYWLQREVSKAAGYAASDAEAGRQLAERVLEALADEDERAVENRLVPPLRLWLPPLPSCPSLSRRLAAQECERVWGSR